MKIKAMLLAQLLAATTLATAGSAPAMAAPHWGKFRDDGIQTIKVDGEYRKVRVYQSVLWGIPWGHSWEATCAKTPAKIKGVYFKRPMACVKSSALQPVSTILAGVGVAGLAFPPAGVVGAVGSVGTTILDLKGIGAMNMWGVFYVNQ